MRYCLPVSSISGSFKSTTLDSHYPTITRYASGGVERLLANWTDGSTTPFIIEQDHHDVIMLLGGEPGKAETTDHPVSRLGVPSEFRLAEGYPNPFNPSTRVRFELPGPAFVSSVIFDDLGKEVVTLVESQYEKGYHSIVWDASTVASGVYYVRMIATGELGKVIYSKTNKLLLIK